MAQSCAAAADCVEAFPEGCCMTGVVTETPEDGVWGDFGELFWAETEGVPVVDYSYNYCSDGSDPEGSWSMLDAFTIGFDALSDEEKEAEGIFPEDTVLDVISYAGSD